MTSPNFKVLVSVLLQPRDLHLLEASNEIASHLDDLYEEKVQAGVPADRAFADAWSQLGSPAQLKRAIRRAQGDNMKQRFQQMWIPALATGFLAYAAQQAIGRAGVRPISIVVQGQYYAGFWQWLVFLLFTGAFGAYWSRQLGGDTRARLVAALAPTEVMLGIMALTAPIGFFAEVILEHRVPYIFTHPVVFLVGISWWALIPAIPSILGALPFLFGSATQEPDSQAPIVA